MSGPRPGALISRCPSAAEEGLCSLSDRAGGGSGRRPTRALDGWAAGLRSARCLVEDDRRVVGAVDRTWRLGLLPSTSACGEASDGSTSDRGGSLIVAGDGDRVTAGWWRGPEGDVSFRVRESAPESEREPTPDDRGADVPPFVASTPSDVPSPGPWFPVVVVGVELGAAEAPPVTADPGVVTRCCWAVAGPAMAR